VDAESIVWSRRLSCWRFHQDLVHWLLGYGSGAGRHVGRDLDRGRVWVVLMAQVVVVEQLHGGEFQTGFQRLSQILLHALLGFLER